MMAKDIGTSKCLNWDYNQRTKGVIMAIQGMTTLVNGLIGVVISR